MVYSLFLGMILNKKRDRAILESESNMNLYKLNIPYIYNIFGGSNIWLSLLNGWSWWNQAKYILY